MRITGIAGVLPSRRVSNEEVIDLVGRHSARGFEGNLPTALKVIGKLFQKSGLESRYWLSDGERPMDLVREAFDRALAQAAIRREEIDLLIYAGVTRGFTEPANSTFVAHALGLACTNYDLINACMGWVSSMDLINDKMKAGGLRHAVIINMEFGDINGLGSPEAYALKSTSDLAYRFPAWTVGSAVTATIVSSEWPDNFKFSFKSRPEMGRLCTISLPGWEHFCNESDVARIAPSGGKFQFSSYGTELHAAMEDEMPALFEQHRERHGILKSDVQCLVTHTSSPNLWGNFCRAVGMADKLHAIGHRTGNVVTASAPLGIADALEQGAVRKNQFCMGLIASAGMVFSAMTFNL